MAIHTPSGGLPPRDPAGNWDKTLEYVERLQFHIEAGTGPSAVQLREIAEHLRDQAPTMNGPMPYRVEAFMEKYGAHEPQP